MDEDRRSLLFLLDGDDAALKLASVWPLLFSDSDVDLQGEAAAFKKRWAARAGVHYSDVDRLWPVLVENGLLGLDGSVDADVAKYVRREISKRLQKGMRSAARQAEK